MPVVTLTKIKDYQIHGNPKVYKRDVAETVTDEVAALLLETGYFVEGQPKKGSVKVVTKAPSPAAVEV
jgi:hypothetical protein